VLLGLRQRRLRKVEPVSNSTECMSQLAEQYSEKYVRSLLGRTDLEDALKRLDKLTHEENWMATAEVLKVSHTVDERVRGIANRVASIDDKVARVDDSVRVVDEKVAVVIRGARTISSPDPLLKEIDFGVPRWNQGKASHTTNSQQRRQRQTFVI